jgi:heterotetrameric sarcosine oxidase gamma subunit
VSEPVVSLSALYGIALPGRYGKQEDEPGVTIAERANLGLATVACRKGHGEDLKGRVRETYGVDLPSSSTVARGKDVSFVGTGPGEWLVVSETHENETLAEDLVQKLAGLASISDQSSGRAVVRLKGPRARDVLAKGLAIDLDPSTFPSGAAVTSTISHMGIQLWQPDSDTYDIVFFRSVAESFWRWLGASSAAFGYEVTAS